MCLSRDKPKDPWYIQALVPLVWSAKCKYMMIRLIPCSFLTSDRVIDTLHTCFMIKYLYYTTVIRYGDVSAIGEASWAVSITLDYLLSLRVS